MDGLNPKYDLLIAELLKRDQALTQLLLLVCVLLWLYFLLNYEWFVPKKVSQWLKIIYQIGGLLIFGYILYLSFSG